MFIMYVEEVSKSQEPDAEIVVWVPGSVGLLYAFFRGSCLGFLVDFWKISKIRYLSWFTDYNPCDYDQQCYIHVDMQSFTRQNY